MHLLYINLILVASLSLSVMSSEPTSMWLKTNNLQSGVIYSICKYRMLIAHLADNLNCTLSIAQSPPHLSLSESVPSSLSIDQVTAGVFKFLKYLKTIQWGSQK